MRTTPMHGAIRKRRRRSPAALLVVASGGQEIPSAVQILNAPLGPDARIVTARYQDMPQGFVLLMSIAVSGGAMSLRRVTALLRRAAEAHGMALSMWPMSKDGGLP